MNAIGPAVVVQHQQGALSLQAVSKTYRAGGRALPVLDQVSFGLAPGEFVSIVGPSGCGKSTLLRLIVGLDDDYDGNITLRGQSLHGPGADRAIVFQDHRLFPWLTVAQNIALGLDNAGLSARAKNARVQEHIGLVRLSGFADAYPHQLSGGMAQRAAIARALVAEPALLLLDEPFGALDSLTRGYLQDELLRIRGERQVTTLMVTHDVEEAVFLSDRVVIMQPNPGRVQRIVAVDVPQPRQREDAEIGLLKQKILNSLKQRAKEAVLF
jgi:ABC-type nitrate/sulfonate/bicarbonate transport system ATPase subunit